MSETAGASLVQDAYEEQKTRIDNIVNEMASAEDTEQERVWKEHVDKYLKEIERYQSMIKLLDIGDEELSQRTSVFLDILENPEFEIAFVGTIKTGKSTLINALLGHNFTPTDVTPETAALTKFRRSEKDYIKIIFYNEEEWKELRASKSQNAVEYNDLYKRLGAEEAAPKWIGHEAIKKELDGNEIEEKVAQWTSSKYAEHFFVKEVELGISTLPEWFPPQVLFVDTPGLFDAVQYRSEIAEKYIRKADAVFFCVDVQRTIREEHDEIQTVFANSNDNKSKVHIVATHWDKLNKPIVDNWKKQKRFFVELFSNTNFFGSEELAEKNILHSSAYMYNLCNHFDENIDELEIFARTLGLSVRGDDDEKIRGLKDQLLESTNIEKIKKVIETELVVKYKQLMVDRIEKIYQELVNNYRQGIREKRMENESK